MIRLLLCQRINIRLPDLCTALNYNVQIAHLTVDLETDPSANDLLNRIFNGFVIHDTSTNSWTFANLSLRSYLENHKDYQTRTNHAFVAICCLKYLSSDDIIDSMRPAEDGQASHKFLNLFRQYACLYWPHHLFESGDLRSQRPLQELWSMYF